MYAAVPPGSAISGHQISPAFEPFDQSLVDQMRQSGLDRRAAHSKEFGYGTFQYNGPNRNLIAEDLLFKNPGIFR